MSKPLTKEEEQCGIWFCRPKFCQKLANVRFFAVVMCTVIAVQGTYLGYIVAVLTNIERRFEISSSKSGALLSMYDIGHTLTVLLVGHFGANRHKPRWTAIGVVVSAVAMFGLSFPNFLYGAASSFEDELMMHKGYYVNTTQCDSERKLLSPDEDHPVCAFDVHEEAYVIMALSQLLAGIAAAPFNTLAYVYIDDNVANRQSPFYLGNF